MKKYLTLLMIVLLPFLLLAQSHISGNVTDMQSRQPVEYANVYINGSTKGTLTDSVGTFHLDNVRFPCTLVISHLSYKTQTIDLNSAPATPLDISLTLKINEIKGISVSDKNLREQNLHTFRKQFLGTNIWAKHATIENEEILQFSRDYIQIKKEINFEDLTHYLNIDPNLQWSPDSMLVTYMAPCNLKAVSNKRMKIRLPLLGYTLHYDLLGFLWTYHPELGAGLCSMLGYYYFVPEDFISKHDSIRIAKNRRKAYYNSPQHFCKSLYENRLAQNGYKIFETQQAIVITNNANVFRNPKSDKEFRLDSCIHRKGEYMVVTGLKGKKFDIVYYSFNNNVPKDITLTKVREGVFSEIIFKKDSCFIREDGTIPNNSIIFGQEIGSKKVGSLLPDDYSPK